jgi:uracil-DNA glycosylase
LPEAEIIDDLVREAPDRVEEMIRHREGSTISARDFLPDERNLSALAEAAQGCRGCELYKRGTQTVFGEGPRTATVMFVGEQPGDQEDLQGKPFVGPAGQLLDKAMEQAGIDRNQAYVTNAVKHFKWEPRGKRRLHAKPNAREMSACRPWLEAEMETLKPKIIVCLGATAAQSLMGPSFRITKQRGQVMMSDWGVQIIATYHPSALLRAPDEVARAEMHKMFLSDLKKVAQLIGNGDGKPKRTVKRKPKPR